MTDYISREAAIEILRPYKIDPFKIGFLDDNIDGFNEGIDTAISCISVEVPAADVRPVVRAEWKQSDYIPGTISCTNCGTRRNSKFKLGGGGAWNFCPNCGAIMREA